MILNFEQRPTDSPFIEAIWRNYSEVGGSFISAAVGHWEIVVTKYNGKVTLTVRGPETQATLAYCPPGAEHYGMYFKMGSFMPYLPASQLRDGGITLPDSIGNSFWLNGSAWEIPSMKTWNLCEQAHAGRVACSRTVISTRAGAPLICQSALHSANSRATADTWRNRQIDCPPCNPVGKGGLYP
jgi:hypothetical protein